VVGTPRTVRSGAAIREQSWAHMKKRIDFRLSLLLGGAVLAGCGGDDITFAPDSGPPPGGEGGTKKDSAVDVTTKDVAKDVAKDHKAEAEAGPTPQRVLVTTNNSSSSELIAVNVATKAVDGRLTFPGDLGTTDARNPFFPFLLEQANNVVARLDPVFPWLVDSSWNILLKDGIDGGYPYTDPVAAVIGAGGKAYVLRYNRNDIAVVQTTQTVDAAPPVAKIDLSTLLQKNDTDGTVEMTAGVFIASTHTLYVVLGNIDQHTVAPPSYDLLCTGTTSTVIAIDTTTDKLMSIGTGPGNSIALTGFDPVFYGTVYDAKNNRLLIAEAGCNLPPKGDAGPGALFHRGVEEVDLATGTTKILLDTSKGVFPAGTGYPTSFVYIDADLAVLGFDASGSSVYRWNPTKSHLLLKIPNAPDTFAYDGAGNLLGTVTTYGDGGSSSTSVVSVAIGTGNQTQLTTPDPFTIPGGFIGGVDVWPKP